MLKQLIIILLVCLSTNKIFCQTISSNIYDHNGISEYAKQFINYGNNFLVLSSIKAESGVPPTGILIREINNKGEILWTDFYKDANDSLGYYNSGAENAILQEDSLLYVFGKAQDVNLDESPFFFKYNLKAKRIVDFKLYNSTYGGNFSSAHLHTDGHFYAFGKIYRNRAYTEYDMLLMKINRDGEVIWKEEYAYGDKEGITDMESYGNELIGVGRTGIERIQTSYIMKIDTSGKVLKFKTLFEFGSVGITELEVYNNYIYFTSNSEEDVVFEETTYLSKMDNEFEVVWDTLIASSSRYNLYTQKLSIINGEIIIPGAIRGTKKYTNWKQWGYATSWSLDGELNWEQRFIYQEELFHYIDDVVGLPNGDLVFMGTLTGQFEEGIFNQNLWLFRTDSQGCGTVQDTCYYTLDQYFGLDTITSISESAYFQFSPLQILGNPFSEQLLLQTKTNQSFDMVIYNVKGQLIYEGLLSGTLQLNTTNWQSGIYVLQLMDDGNLVGVEKLVRE